MTERLQLPMPTAESVAREFHDVYERLSPLMGYETNYASRKPWPEVPERNRILMQATALHVLAYVEKYILGSLEIGSLLHRDTIPLHAIGDVVDHYRAGLPVSDVKDRLHATIMWLAKVGGGVPAMPYPALTAAPRFVEAGVLSTTVSEGEREPHDYGATVDQRNGWRLRALEAERKLQEIPIPAIQELLGGPTTPENLHESRSIVRLWLQRMFDAAAMKARP